MHSNVLYSRFDVEWEKEMKKEKSKRSFTRAILGATGKCYWATAIILFMIGMVLSFVPVGVMSLFIDDLDQGNSGSCCRPVLHVDQKRYWIYAVVLLIAPLISSLINSAVQMMLVNIAISMRGMACEAIYRKALRLTSTAKGSTSTGQLVNIMSTDTNVLLQFIQLTNLFVMIPVMVLFIPSYDS